jgi:hypothetical protein
MGVAMLIRRIAIAIIAISLASGVVLIGAWLLWLFHQ